MFIDRASHSKLDTYEECKLKYYRKYVEHLPEQRDTKATDFGSFIHKVFEECPNSQNLDELVEKAVSLVKRFNIPEDYFDLTITCLKHFIEFNAKLTSKTLSTELKFKLEVPNDVPYNGVIDRIEQSEQGSLLILDYKTSKSEKDIKNLREDKQLTGYAFAANKLYNVPYSKIVVGILYVRTGKFITTQVTELDVKKFLAGRRQLIWEIRKSKKNDFKPKKQKYCNWCGFKSVCPLFFPDTIVESRLKLLKPKPKPTSHIELLDDTTLDQSTHKTS